MHIKLFTYNYLITILCILCISVDKFVLFIGELHIQFCLVLILVQFQSSLEFKYIYINFSVCLCIVIAQFQYMKIYVNMCSLCLQHTSLSPNGKQLVIVGDNPDGLLVDAQTGKVYIFNLYIYQELYQNESSVRVYVSIVDELLIYNFNFVYVDDCTSMRTLGLFICIGMAS